MWKWLDNLFRRKWLEMSFGELCDKIAILRVKLRRLSPTDARIPIILEQLDYLEDGLLDYVELNLSKQAYNTLNDLIVQLVENANTQWDFEDAMSRIGDDVPVEERLAAMKGSYLHNRQRAILKRQVDDMFGEKWKEVKQYSGMTQNTGEYKI